MRTYTCIVIRSGTEDDMKALEQDFLDGKYHPFSSNEQPLSPCHEQQQTHSPQHMAGHTLCETGQTPRRTKSRKPPSKKRRKTSGEYNIQLYTCLISPKLLPREHEGWSVVATYCGSVFHTCMLVCTNWKHTCFLDQENDPKLVKGYQR